ncbi:MAG TPA: AI-2E family transporter [Stellaceae bacterium]|nr:AI-2E family transporter [Stellaceae bacterium]
MTDADPANAAPEPPSQQRARFVVAAVFVISGLWILHDFLPALAWAVVLSIALWPLYERLLALFPERSGRIFAPLLLTLTVGVVFVTPLVLLGIAIAHESHVLIQLVISARHNGLAVPQWVSDVPVVGPSIADWWRTNLSDPIMAEALFGQINPRMFAESAREYGGEAVRRLIIFLFTLLTMFFLFRNGSVVATQLRGLSDRVLGKRGEGIGRHMINAVHGTVNGLVLVGLAEGVVLGVVYIAAGLPYPASIAGITGVFAVIPFGAPLVYTLAALYMLSIGKTLSAAIVFAAGSIVVFVADHFIRPAIIGGSARLPFLWVLLGLLGGLETLGIIGLFLGPAIMAALIALWRDWTDTPVQVAAKAPEPARRAARGSVIRPRPHRT